MKNVEVQLPNAKLNSTFGIRHLALLLSAAFALNAVAAEQSHFKAELIPSLVDRIPQILQSQDPKTGQFGDKPWIVIDQNAMFPLAVAYSHKLPGNPYYHDPKVLTAIIKAGDALIAAQDDVGMWTFRKKDNSTWGQIYMPWTYSRWAKAYALTRDDFRPADRARWDKALTLGMTGIAKTELAKHLQNIPATNAMGLYCFGKLMHRDDWCKAAADYLHRIADAQDPGGFWTEHLGPVMNYNFVYVAALGDYYGMSHDPYVLPALRHAALYHANFTYPDGTPVETVDERNPYERSIVSPGLGFIFSPIGRGYMTQQYALKKSDPVGADAAADIIDFGEEGDIVMPSTAKDHGSYVMGKNDAMTTRSKPWFACLSAYACPQSKERWIQDRQNFLSIFHDKTGLILGGGNTKLQPLWSTFTAGDTSLLHHKKGDENPDFIAPPGIIHIPSKIILHPDTLAMDLTYGNAQCAISVKFVKADVAIVTCQLKNASKLPVEAHLTFLPHMKSEWRCASGKSGKLTAEPFKLTSAETGDYFSHHGWLVFMPKGSTLQWPVLPHNPYTKDGSAKTEEGRIVLTIPLGTQPTKRDIAIAVQ